ncbi:MAG: DUF4838 domain-containing protein [Clostridia bacterium]|nr:DUF4838 domain-containing protein [Clostridia bacterium]MBQ8369995.1 DUF4838 domain-containing protein [Clostridia bacterium]
MNRILAADKGTAYLPIVVGTDAPQEIQTAARDLSHILWRMTGAKFSITDSCDAPSIHFSVDPSLEEEQFAIRSCAETGLKISGGSGQGVMYGIYALLEDLLGVRFYSYDVTKIPKRETLEFDAIDYTDKPALEHRQLDYAPLVRPEWSARNRLNGAGPDRWYGGIRHGYALYVHTFNHLCSPDVYFDEHPEYFSMINGERIRNQTQLCLTNPDVLKIVVENVKKALRANPSARIVSVSQNDWRNACECPECAKIDAENGSQSGTMITFVNKVAEAIEEEFPDVVVDTLAYMYTRRPPKLVKPRHNVCVRLCSIECCFAHPLETCREVTCGFKLRAKPTDTSFQEDLIGWGRICDRIYIWDYVTNYRYFWLPFPNFQVLGPNMRFFVKNGVRGVYEEGNYQSVSPDMTEMRTWLLAKLLWNPDFDVEAGILEFTEAVYGPAAAEIREYIAHMQKRLLDGGIHFGIFEHPDTPYIDEPTITKAKEIIAKAQAKNLPLSQRIYVEKVAFSLEFTEIARDIYNETVDPERIDAMYDTARTLGITSMAEGWHMDIARHDLLDGKLFKERTR